MTITKQMNAHLERLLETGLFGTTVEDVMERLLCERVRQLIESGELKWAGLESNGPRCARCGSPKITALEAMGNTTWQCQDCGTQFS